MRTHSLLDLRHQLTSEQQAAQHGLSGLAQVASHRTITARMQRAWSRVQTLQAAGNAQEAQSLLLSDGLYEAGDEAESSTREAKRP